MASRSKFEACVEDGNRTVRVKSLAGGNFFAININIIDKGRIRTVAEVKTMLLYSMDSSVQPSHYDMVGYRAPDRVTMDDNTAITAYSDYLEAATSHLEFNVKAETYIRQ